MNRLQFRGLNAADSPAALLNLINSAYRGTDGAGRWTTEAHLVAGDRISERDLQVLLVDPQLHWLLAESSGEVCGCIAIKQYPDVTELGTFAIAPSLQGTGLGKQLLAQAESIAQSRLLPLQVTVVSLNSALIQFYQRRGYQDTGLRLPYPVEQNVGTPLQAGIELVVLQKSLRN